MEVSIIISELNWNWASKFVWAHIGSCPKLNMINMLSTSVATKGLTTFLRKSCNFEIQKILWLNFTQDLFPYLFVISSWINALRNFVGNYCLNVLWHGVKKKVSSVIISVTTEIVCIFEKVLENKWFCFFQTSQFISFLIKLISK